MSDAVRDNPYTRELAQFVSSLSYEQIPENVLQRIKLLMLDSLGCALYGTHLPWSRILLETLKSVDTSSGAQVWGTNERLSLPHAALMNGTLVQGFELDDVHRQGVLHVGAVVLPALLAVAESRRNLSGKEFLASAVAGYEVGPRVGVCMGAEHIAQGWHSGATLGVFSAAAGAARGLGLDPQKTVHALGVAGTQAAGLMAAQYGSMVKRMHAGRSSQSGLYGALLAERGFTGIEAVLESEYGGFCTTFSRSQDRFQLNELVNGLGQIWQTMGVALKFYSCVGSNHTTLDAIRNMQAKHPFGPNDLDHIMVSGSQVTMDHVGWTYKPEGLTSAQLNLPYCVATLLLEGECFVDQFKEELVADPVRMKLANLVRVQHDEKITSLGSKFRHMVHVEVFLKDGTRLKDTVEYPRGSEHNFACEADVVHKFEHLASQSLPHHQVSQLVECMLNLENESDAGRIVDLMKLK
jgi:2-methylcitrate dehydratase PrpD